MGIQPSGEVRLLNTGGLYLTTKQPGRVPLIMSGACIVDWHPACEDYPVDGFFVEPPSQPRPRTSFNDKGKSPKLSKDDLQRGEVSKIDPMLMLSMLNYFDHPEFFRSPVGAVDMNKRPTKFIMIAAVRREHPFQNSSPIESSVELSGHKYEELKRNICRG